MEKASPLWSSLVRMDEGSAGKNHSRLQKGVDQAFQTLVCDFPTDSRHEDVVIHFVEELFQVHIHNPLSSGLLVFPRLPDCVVRTPFGTETIAVFGKIRIEDRTQHLTDSLLNQPVNHCWNTKLAHSAARLRDFDPLDRIWLVGFFQQSLPDAGPCFPEIFGSNFDESLVHAYACRIYTNAIGNRDWTLM